MGGVPWRPCVRDTDCIRRQMISVFHFHPSFALSLQILRYIPKDLRRLSEHIGPLLPRTCSLQKPGHFLCKENFQILPFFSSVSQCYHILKRKSARYMVIMHRAEILSSIGVYFVRRPENTSVYGLDWASALFRHIPVMRHNNDRNALFV